ncbi:MAG: lysophospholipid acyltransferase family protein [Opitutaceae bacterium]
MDSAHSVHSLAGWRSVLLWPAAMLLKLWGGSLRFDLSPESLAQLSRRDRPIVLVTWHNRLFLGAEAIRRFRRRRPMCALISASRDGAWLAAFFSTLGMRAVRGSSNRRGREAVEALVDAVKAGCDAGITPDGPRGPCYEFKAGALVVARATGAPVILLSCGFSSGWRLNSWDRFWLPRPFSRLHVVCEEAQASWLDDREQAAARLQRRLREITKD